MIEKMKKLPFIEESEVVKVDFYKGTFTRYDRTDRIIELISKEIELEGEGEIYVDTKELIALLPEAIKITFIENGIKVTLKNLGEYIIEGRDISFPNELPNFTDSKFLLKFTLPRHLGITTSKNLIMPILQCIYIDEKSAVSTDSENMCVDDTITCEEVLLLTRDLINYIQDTEVELYGTEDTLYIKGSNYIIVSPRVKLGEENVFDFVRKYLPNEFINKTEINSSTLISSLERLKLFGEFVEFADTEVRVNNQFEPFISNIIEPDFVYSIRNLLEMLPYTKYIYTYEKNIVLEGEGVKFISSPKHVE